MCVVNLFFSVWLAPAAAVASRALPLAEALTVSEVIQMHDEASVSHKGGSALGEKTRISSRAFAAISAVVAAFATVFFILQCFEAVKHYKAFNSNKPVRRRLAEGGANRCPVSLRPFNDHSRGMWKDRVRI